MNRAWIKKYGLIFLMIFISAGVKAQDFQPFLFEFIPASDIVQTNNTSPNNLNIEVTRLSIGEVIPTIYCRKNSRILYGIRYDLLYLNYDNWNFPSNEPEYLHFIRNEFTLIQNISENWQITGLVNVGLATDLKEKISWDDVHIHAYTYLSNVTFPEVGYGFGIIYTSDFGSPLFLPLIRGYWKPSEQFRFDLFIPKNVSFRYIPNKSSEIGIKSMVYGNRYHLGKYTPNGNNANLNYSVITLGPVFKHRLFSCFFLVAEAGYTLHRRFEIQDSDFSEKLNPDNNYYFRAGLIFRPRK